MAPRLTPRSVVPETAFRGRLAQLADLLAELDDRPPPDRLVLRGLEEVEASIKALYRIKNRWLERMLQLGNQGFTGWEHTLDDNKEGT